VLGGTVSDSGYQLAQKDSPKRAPLQRNAATPRRMAATGDTIAGQMGLRWSELVAIVQNAKTTERKARARTMVTAANWNMEATTNC